MKNYFDFAGHKGRQVTFIMTDSEVKKEEFLEYINMILSTGEIAKDQKEVWLGEVRNDYRFVLALARRAFGISGLKFH